MKKHAMKLIAVLFAAVMVFSLAACGGSGGGTEPAGSGAAPAGSGAAAAPASTSNDGKTHIKVTCFNGENDFMCQQLLHVCDYVEAHDDSIVFDKYLNSQFCTLIEEFGNLSDGAIDMCALMESAGQASAMLSLFQYARPADTCADAVERCNTLLNEDPETSPLLLGQAEEHNIIPLGYSITGVDAFCSTKPATTLDDLRQGKLGSTNAMMSSLYEDMGLNVEIVQMQDLYEGLSRGKVDSATIPISVMVANKLYEVAPNVLTSEKGGCSGLISLNLDTWNSLTPEQQQLFRDGYADAQKWAAEEYDKLFKSNVEEMEAAGCTVNMMTEEDDALKNTVQLQSAWDSGHEVAEQQGLLDEFTLIFDKGIEGSGLKYEK